MRPSFSLALHRIAIRETVTRYRTENPRVFGSVVHGDDLDGSDLIYWSMRFPA